jgi:hypothetical protein
MRMQPDFEKANEIYFRLGIIYKQQQKFQQSLEVCVVKFHPCGSLTSFQCFKYIVTDPPRPLNEEDIWFQIGHVHEQQKDVSLHVFPFRGSTHAHNSTKAPRLRTGGFWTETQNTQRCYNSSDGCTTSKATVTPAKTKQSSILNSLSVPVSPGIRRRSSFYD